VRSLPPFYALGPVRPVLTTTVGGIKTDINCRVLNGQGRVVLGFYAIGDGSAGGVQLLHGTYVGWSLLNRMILTDFIAKF
jgi:predicted oxidoreductase